MTSLLAHNEPVALGSYLGNRDPAGGVVYVFLRRQSEQLLKIHCNLWEEMQIGSHGGLCEPCVIQLFHYWLRRWRVSAFTVLADDPNWKVRTGGLEQNSKWSLQIGQLTWGQQDEMPQRQMIYFEGKNPNVTHDKGNEVSSIMLGIWGWN